MTRRVVFVVFMLLSPLSFAGFWQGMNTYCQGYTNPGPQSCSSGIVQTVHSGQCTSFYNYADKMLYECWVPQNGDGSDDTPCGAGDAWDQESVGQGSCKADSDGDGDPDDSDPAPNDPNYDSNNPPPETPDPETDRVPAVSDYDDAVSDENGNPVPPNVIDQNGNEWAPVPETVQCDSGSGLCGAEYVPTGDTYDYNDSSTWPEGAVDSDGPGAPDGVDQDGFIDPESDPFTDFNNSPVGIPVIVETDTKNWADNETGTTTDETTTTKIDTDGTKITEKKTTETYSDGTKKETTETKTTNKDTGETTTTTVVKDIASDGTETVVISGTTTDEGEQEEEGESVSGGGQCSSPPLCSGDPIQCAILTQTWKDRCNSDYKVANVGGGCLNAFQCDGDPIACAALKLEHVKYCDAQDAADTLGQDMDDAIAALSAEKGQPTTDSEGVLTSFQGNDIDIESSVTGVLNTSKPFSAGCPSPVTVNLSVGNVQFDYQPVCDAANSLAVLVRLLAALIAGYIYFRGLTS